MMVFSVGNALGALSLISGITRSSALTIERRAGIVPASLPGTWVSEGCYVDIGRTLAAGGYDSATMTIESCISYCGSAGYIFAGVEYSQECYCSNTIASGATQAPLSDCSMTCAGNATEACGGGNRLNLFWSGTSGPLINPGQGNWTFSGCYAEGTTGRTLTQGATVSGGSSAMTVDLCLAACKGAGYPLAGVEYAGECYCDISIQNGGALASDGPSGCNMLCNGNKSEYCGGSSRLVMYDYNKQVTLPPYTTITTSSSVQPTIPSSSSQLSSTSSSAQSTTGSSSTYSPTSSSSTHSSSPSSSSHSSTTSHSTSTSHTSSSTSSTHTSTSSAHSSSLTSTSHNSTSSGQPSSSTSAIQSSTSTNISPSTQTPISSSVSASSSSIVASSPSSTSSAPQVLATKPAVSGYSFQGCYTEATNGRALSAAAIYDYTAMTLEECASNCVGYTYWGVEYGGECYCGNTINTGSVIAAITDCSFVCPGNQYEYCGAGNRLEMYKLGLSSVSISSTGVSSATSSSLSSSGATTLSTSTSAFSSSTRSGTSTLLSSSTYTSTSSSSSAHSSTTSYSSNVSVTFSSTTSSASSTATGFTYQGCYVDGTNGRILNNQIPDSQTNSQEVCIAACQKAGYTIAGMEYSTQCFCDNAIYNGGVLATDQTTCNDPCSGNTVEMCGGGSRMSLFSVGTPRIYQPPAIQTTGLPANWVYKGCLQDNIPSAEDPNEIISTFPYMVWNNASNTADACITQCQAFGYNAAGLEYGSECFCGDVQNIQVASAPGVSTNPNAVQFYTRSAIPQIVADSQCNSICAGDSRYLCGSGNLMAYYAWVGPEPMYTFGFPTGQGAGTYSLLIGGVVVPLMTSQGVNGKVQFTEKYGTGEPNGTGAYELDLTEIDNFSAAWRTMNGMETDVFCSAGLTLPDKAGRQLTVGGWAGQSNFGVRLYWPDGSAGVEGTNEWQEDSGVLSLQVPRWYPSAMVMANGSIMIVGGEVGDNSAEQPNLELLPATGVPDASTSSGYSNTTVYLDFLDRTQPFNLYPFVAVCPTGIFIAYYNEARILNENTFQTVKTLPNMPAAVNDPTGGRTYQLEGAMSLLPQHAPYTENLGVLICGGSTSGGGYPIDNCISMRPEDPEPTWVIERMPSRRVMPCMAGLPDGTYVIVNGAQHGVAGFGLGGDPNYNAVLYDPSKPVNQRMSIMANTTVARLYHSEAIVLLDGRVMISGSDPTGDYTDPAGSWNEEYRVEVFTPPYLLSNLPRPTFTLSSFDWDYAQSISFTLNSGSTANLQVSMLGSVVSTHGNAMGQRTIFPAVSCQGTLCTIVAPPDAHRAPPGWFMVFVLDGPTPSVGQFVRIGKDPAKIGEWPAGIPAFQPLPGV